LVTLLPFKGQSKGTRSRLHVITNCITMYMNSFSLYCDDFVLGRKRWKIHKSQYWNLNENIK